MNHWLWIIPGIYIYLTWNITYNAGEGIQKPIFLKEVYIILEKKISITISIHLGLWKLRGCMVQWLLRK